MPSQQDRYLVTGVAGFIGSHVAEALVGQGHLVTGVDAFTTNYPRSQKAANLAGLRSGPRFRLIEGNLLRLDLPLLLEETDVVIHLAGEPGVRSSWGDQFGPYLDNNVHATQVLLEAARGLPNLRRMVYASSSSVYGDALELPVSEAALPRPKSPYGVTKLAAEHLCSLYARQFGLPTVSLRFFTVFGPRQRPDMAFARFIRALLARAEIAVFGKGDQTRDFTYVDDVVSAVLAAGGTEFAGASGSVYNLGGGVRTPLRSAISLLEELTGRRARLRFDAKEPGDVRDTWADCSAARRDLGFVPTTDLRTGLAKQVEWERGQEAYERAAA
jgi:nucleoside-diphosphate-sugar epimerase